MVTTRFYFPIDAVESDSITGNYITATVVDWRCTKIGDYKLGKRVPIIVPYDWIGKKETKVQVKVKEGYKVFNIRGDIIVSWK